MGVVLNGLAQTLLVPALVAPTGVLQTHGVQVIDVDSVSHVQSALGEHVAIQFRALTHGPRFSLWVSLKGGNMFVKFRNDLKFQQFLQLSVLFFYFAIQSFKEIDISTQPKLQSLGFLRQFLNLIVFGFMTRSMYRLQNYYQ